LEIGLPLPKEFDWKSNMFHKSDSASDFKIQKSTYVQHPFPVEWKWWTPSFLMKSYKKKQKGRIGCGKIALKRIG